MYDVKVIILNQFQNPIITKMKTTNDSIIIKDPMIAIVSRVDEKSYLAPFPPLARKDQEFFISFSDVIMQYEPEDNIKKKYLEIVGEDSE